MEIKSNEKNIDKDKIFEESKSNNVNEIKINEFNDEKIYSALELEEDSSSSKLVSSNKITRSNITSDKQGSVIKNYKRTSTESFNQKLSEINKNNDKESQKALDDYDLKLNLAMNASNLDPNKNKKPKIKSKI